MFLLPVAGATELSGLLALRDEGCVRGPDIDATQTSTPNQAGGLKFHRAVLLLRILARGAELRQAAERQSADLAVMKHLLASREREVERLRVLRRATSAPGGARTCRSSGPRRSQLVGGVLERLHREFARPLSLRQLARDHGMNATYLSSIFAHEVGMPFKSYLTTLRLQRAQELLGNPLWRVSEVAYAVGYATSDRFRSAFRQWAGLAPSQWRGLLRVRPDVGSGGDP